LNTTTMKPLFEIIEHHVQHYCPKKGTCRHQGK
jgi:hypothetical protein